MSKGGTKMPYPYNDEQFIQRFYLSKRGYNYQINTKVFQGSKMRP